MIRNDDIVRIENTAFKSNVLDIRWRVTSLCNYSCDFCIQGDKEAHRLLAEGESRETRMTICRELRRMIDEAGSFDRIIISLVGGEVTILKELPEIMSILSESRFPGEIRFEITTNFSQPAEYFTGIFDILKKRTKYGKRSLHLALSYYEAYTSPEAFTDKVKAVSAAGFRKSPFEKLLGRGHGKKGFGLGLDVVCPIITDKDLAVCRSMERDLAGSGARVRPLPIREYKTDISPAVRKEMMKELKKDPTLRVTMRDGSTLHFRNIQALGQAEAEGHFCPEGYTCDAGICNLWVNAFGEVYRCPAIGSDMRMGSLIDGSFRMLTEPAVCTSDHCSCSQFGTIEKI